MINIFDVIEKNPISTMLSECTGFKVQKGDRCPENICTSCLQDVKVAFKLKKTYERSRQIYSQLNRDSLEDDILEESNTEEGGLEYVSQVKEESDDLQCKEDSLSYLCQVKNEPLEEDMLEEQHSPLSEDNIDQCDSQVKIEQTIYDGSDEDHDSVDNESKIYSPNKCRPAIMGGTGGMGGMTSLPPDLRFLEGPAAAMDDL